MFSKELFSFYEGKKVLVAGASGMTGHNLFDAMKVLGADVTGTYCSNNDYYADNTPMFKRVDFTHYGETRNFFKYNKFDYVFICCAKTYNAQVCKDNPESLILPNIQMASNILGNCRSTGVRKVLYISSATVYQPSDKDSKETDLDLNQEPYSLYKGIGSAKRYMEKLCEFYSTLGLSTIIVRPTNIYGRYDKIDSDKCHVVPALIMRALNKDNPYILNSLGEGIKNFIHVSDFVRDLSKAMMCKDVFNIFNLCSDTTISIKEVAEIILDCVGNNPEIQFKNKEDYVKYLNLDRGRFDNIFGKDSYIDIKSGLKDTIEWYSLLHQTQKQLTTV